jgi:hypothetical protein
MSPDVVSLTVGTITVLRDALKMIAWNIRAITNVADHRWRLIGESFRVPGRAHERFSFSRRLNRRHGPLPVR